MPAERYEPDLEQSMLVALREFEQQEVIRAAEMIYSVILYLVDTSIDTVSLLHLLEHPSDDLDIDQQLFKALQSISDNLQQICELIPNLAAPFNFLTATQEQSPLSLLFRLKHNLELIQINTADRFALEYSQNNPVAEALDMLNQLMVAAYRASNLVAKSKSSS
jgi:hypothetical protein